MLYSMQERREEAERLLKRALDMTVRTLGPEHPQVGDWSIDLARLYEQDHAGRLSDLEVLYRRALSAFGDRAQTAVAMNGLGELYTEQGKLNEAEPLLREALAMRQRLFPPDHFEVASSHEGLARLLTARGDFVQAEALFQKALPVVEREMGPNHALVAIVMEHYADLLQKMGRAEEAEALVERATAIRSARPSFSKHVP